MISQVHGVVPTIWLFTLLPAQRCGPPLKLRHRQEMSSAHAQAGIIDDFRSEPKPFLWREKLRQPDDLSIIKGRVNKQTRIGYLLTLKGSNKLHFLAKNRHRKLLQVA